MKLYGSSLSPYYERCIITLDVKGALDKVETPEIEGGAKSPEHFAANPTGRIPYLVLDNGNSIIESQIIAEYLDAALDGTPTIPADAESAAHAKMIARIVDIYMAPAMEHFWVNRGYPADQVKIAAEEKLPAAFDYLERFISESGYASGNSWSVADAAIIPWLFHMKLFAKKHGIDGFGDRPKLQAWHEAIKQSDIGQNSFSRSSKALDKVMAAAKK